MVSYSMTTEQQIREKTAILNTEFNQSDDFNRRMDISNQVQNMIRDDRFIEFEPRPIFRDISHEWEF